MVHFDLNQSIYLVITTESDQNNAHKMANYLLEGGLIACISFKNIESYFWWEGEINQSKEVQLVIKCKESNINKVCKKISECHSYEVPEIIFFPVSTNEDYHRWVNSF